jgi:ribosomal-protein-serine acetyltransferase
MKIQVYPDVFSVLTRRLPTCTILNIMNDIKPDIKKVSLTDGKILLRPYRKDDVETQYRATLMSLKELMDWMPWAHTGYDISETKIWLKKCAEDWKNGTAYNFIICDIASAEVIGGCGLQLNKIDNWANLGYWVRSDRTGQGIAVAATKLLAKWGFDVLKMNRLEIHVAVDNQRSLRVAEKSGAKREGILRNRMMLNGKAHDAVMHSLIPGEA